MLEPITKIVTDKSTDKNFSFTFYCDICKEPWDSIPTQAHNNESALIQNECSFIRQSDHNAAYERANLEAMQHFNRCPVCRRWVCDECFSITDDRDVCTDCAKLKPIEKKR